MPLSQSLWGCPSDFKIHRTPVMQRPPSAQEWHFSNSVWIFSWDISMGIKLTRCVPVNFAVCVHIQHTEDMWISFQNEIFYFFFNHIFWRKRKGQSWTHQFSPDHPHCLALRSVTCKLLMYQRQQYQNSSKASTSVLLCCIWECIKQLPYSANSPFICRAKYFCVANLFS